MGPDPDRTAAMSPRASAIILAGGGGTRFWPLSRRRRPKQLVELGEGTSLLRATVERLPEALPRSAVWVATTAALRDAVAAQLPEVPPEQILVEPVGRDTAPAIGWAIGRLPEAARAGVVAVLPADHHVADVDAFRQTLERAIDAVARDDSIMTLGVRPTRAETGFGYLELGEVLDAATGMRRVVRFREKPDLETARGYAASGDYLWNSGIFVFRGRRLLERLEAHQPEIARGLAAIDAEPERLTEIYRTLPALSIDFAVMEKLDDLVTLPLDCGWTDLGAWSALAEVLGADESGNAVEGDGVVLDGESNLLFAEDGTIVALGVSDLVIVRSGDCVLVVPKERAQEVREVVAELERRGRDDLV